MIQRKQYQQDEPLNDEEEYLEGLRSEHADNVRKQALINRHLAEKSAKQRKVQFKDHQLQQ